MGLNFRILSSYVSVLPLTKLRNTGRLLLLAGLVLAFSVGTARSYVSDGNENVSRETSYSFDAIINMTEAVKTAEKIKQSRASDFSSSSAAGNLCTSLLNTQDTHSAKTPAVRTQRPVGKVAALGMLLGARFALAPPEQHNRAVVSEPDVMFGCQVVKLDEKDAPSRTARDIAAYRQCQKDLALARIASAR